jgi:tRNA-modifying protein YgfZ
MDAALEDQIRALRERRAFVRPTARTIRVSGADAGRWLNDLVTAGIERLADGASVRSLILSPTGRIRAEFHVLRDGDACLLAQTIDQPEAIDTILAPYVLSSAVRLDPDGRSPVLVPTDEGWRAALRPPPDADEVDAAAAERWRIESGVARFPADLDVDSLPAEAGLDVPPVTDTGKGCFLGQESVARVRNLGHPTRLVRAVEADAALRPGEPVLAAGAEVGLVTSAVVGAGAWRPAIVRIRWDARDADLRTGPGTTLRPR